MSLGVHRDDGDQKKYIGGRREPRPAAETNKRMGRGSAPRGASCSSSDPADYAVAADPQRPGARPVRVKGKNACMVARPH